MADFREWIGKPIPPGWWKGKEPPTLPQVWGEVEGCWMCSQRRFHDDGHKTREEWERDHPGETDE